MIYTSLSQLVVKNIGSRQRVSKRQVCVAVPSTASAVAELESGNKIDNHEFEV